jgi:diguanylate cyclase (GGDEF)-like protein
MTQLDHPEEARMKAPPKPPDEDRRIRTLQSLGILDTPAEERFDRVTRLACRLFGVPIALVSLVDEDRQWFKSRQGLDATETPREISFCGHSILGREVMLVEDADLDERFSDNPLVCQDPAIRFYAGAPLEASDGSRLGTLCLIDREPRTLDEDEIALLRDLADMVERELVAIQLATLDELTGLSNRRGFETMARHALASCRRIGRPVSLLYIDLDGFKQINDEHGHAEGDRALVEMAGCLLRAFRDSDVVARIGGDEFCVLLTDAGDGELKAPIERLAEEVEATNRSGRSGWQLRYSYGVATLDAKSTLPIDMLLDQADASMYRRRKEKRRQPSHEGR